MFYSVFSPGFELHKSIEKWRCVWYKRFFNINDLSKLRQELRFKRIVKFVDEHIKNVGYEQAVKDLQVGLTILNGCRRNSPCECKNALKYDGIFGDKTKATLNDACKNYSAFKDYKNINPKNVDGRYFKSNSKPSIELSKTKEIKEFIKQHKYEIINNTLFNNKEYQSIEFPAGDWYYAVHYADIIDAYFDENGNLHVIMTDTYDFNKGESKLIEAGREAMKRGALEPRFLIWDILIPKADLDKI